MLPGGVGCVLPGGYASRGVCLRGGGVFFPGDEFRGGVFSGGALGGCFPGVCFRGEVVSQHALRQTPLCEQNDRQVQKYYLGHNFIATGKIKDWPKLDCTCHRISAWYLTFLITSGSVILSQSDFKRHSPHPDRSLVGTLVFMSQTSAASTHRDTEFPETVFTVFPGHGTHPFWLCPKVILQKLYLAPVSP